MWRALRSHQAYRDITKLFGFCFIRFFYLAGRSRNFFYNALDLYHVAQSETYFTLRPTYADLESEICWSGERHMLIWRATYADMESDICWSGERHMLIWRATYADLESDICWSGERHMLIWRATYADLESERGFQKEDQMESRQMVSGIIFPPRKSVCASIFYTCQPSCLYSLCDVTSGGGGGGVLIQMLWGFLAQGQMGQTQRSTNIKVTEKLSENKWSKRYNLIQYVDQNYPPGFKKEGGP